MLNEYVEKHIKNQLYEFMERFGANKFDASYDMILNLAMGKADNQGFWTLYQKKDGLHIIYHSTQRECKKTVYYG